MEEIAEGLAEAWGPVERENIRADEAEHAVWSFVTGLLLNPEALREGLDEMIERERAGNHGNPEEEAAAWLDRLADVERKSCFAPAS